MDDLRQQIKAYNKQKSSFIEGNNSDPDKGNHDKSGQENVKPKSFVRILAIEVATCLSSSPKRNKQEEAWRRFIKEHFKEKDCFGDFSRAEVWRNVHIG